jgi:hypothetical protein
MVRIHRRDAISNNEASFFSRLQGTMKVIVSQSTTSTTTTSGTSGRVAQLVELSIRNRRVIGSTPTLTSKKMKRGREAVTRQAHNLKIVGSNPTCATNTTPIHTRAGLRDRRNNRKAPEPCEIPAAALPVEFLNAVGFPQHPGATLGRVNFSTHRP